MVTKNLEVPKRALAIGAHPDDIEIFMFGFLCSCQEMGHKISTVIATDGSLGGNNDDKKLIENRKKELIGIISMADIRKSLINNINKFTKIKGINKTGTYNEAIMDFGSLICKPKNPKCEICNTRKTCFSYILSLIHI